jgi:hypothetical protein
MSKALVVEFSKNPSTDFFVASELHRRGYDVSYATGGKVSIKASSEYSVLVISRYISRSWRDYINNNLSSFEEIAYFMDDDLLDLKSSAGLPLRYRYKIWKYAFRHKAWLQSTNVQLWVSTVNLANKYDSWSPKIITPKSVDLPLEPVSIFYHASASHIAEMQWLFPIIKNVLEKRPNCRFEIVGNPEINSLYRKLERVHVLMPMSWESYKFLLASGSYDIGLAPLLNSQFNDFRSYTKFFDITSAGAVGIYGDHVAFSDFVNDHTNGLLLPMEPLAWESALLELIDNKALRLRLLQKAAEFL